MRTLALLLGKDFRRTFRNPWPWILNLALPLAITGLIGLAFGGRGGGDSKGEAMRIKFALVDEDQSFLSRALRSMLTQDKAGEHLEPKFVDRIEALRVLRENQISAILIIPTNFTSKYLAGESGLKLEVIKNPAQSFMPAIVEEIAATAVTALNAISRNLQSEFPKVQAAFTNDFQWEQASEVMKTVGARIKAAREFLDPPLVSYQKEVVEKNNKKSATKNIAFSVFGYILPGMASAFLLFMADHSMRDYHREVRMKTIDRQRTVGPGVGAVVAGKIIFTALSVMLGAAILFGAATITFGIEWRHPGLLALACGGYSLFAAGLMSMLAALAPSERRLDAVNSILIFTIAFVGGSYVPSDNFPRVMRETITPMMPNYWFIEAVRALQNAELNYLPPMMAVAKLAAVGVVCAIIAAIFIERRLTSGARA